MSEQEADNVMEAIEDMTLHTCRNDPEMLKHLYELHKLRDEKLIFQLCMCFPLGDAEFWNIHSLD